MDENRPNGSSGASSKPVARPVACLNCRKRKSKCDRGKPSCGQCVKHGLQCSYDERKKSGPKRGYIKQLEQRLAALEGLMRGTDQNSSTSSPEFQDKIYTDNTLQINGITNGSWSVPADSTYGTSTKRKRNDSFKEEGSSSSSSSSSYRNNYDLSHAEEFTGCSNTEAGMSFTPQSTHRPEPRLYDDDDQTHNMNDIMQNDFLDEPLPDASIIDELHELFFSKIYSSVLPFFDRRRYLSNYYRRCYSVCYLWYGVWLITARTLPKFNSLAPIFHKRCHHYLFKAEMMGTGEATCCLEYIQALLILASDEFRYRNLPRGWIDLGKAIRCCLQLSIQRLDADSNEELQTDEEDDMAKEECRRTFWHAYVADRLSTAVAGCPMTFVDEYIHVYLPIYDTNIEKRIDCEPITLSDIYTEKGARYLEKAPTFVCNIISSYAGGCATRLNLVTIGIPFSSEQQDFSNKRFADYWRLYMNVNHQLDEVLGRFKTTPREANHAVTIEALLSWNIVMMILNLTFYERVVQCAPFKGRDDALDLARERCLNVISQTEQRVGSIDTEPLYSIPNLHIFILYITTKALVVFSQSPSSQISHSSDRPIDIEQLLAAHLKAMKNLSSQLPIVKALLFDINLRLEGNEHREFILDDAPLRFLVPRKLIPISKKNCGLGGDVDDINNNNNNNNWVVGHKSRHVERQLEEQQQQYLHATAAAAVGESQHGTSNGFDASSNPEQQLNIFSVLTQGTQSHFYSMKRKWDEQRQPSLPPSSSSSSSKEIMASFQYLSSPLGFGIKPPPPPPPSGI